MGESAISFAPHQRVMRKKIPTPECKESINLSAMSKIASMEIPEATSKVHQIQSTMQTKSTVLSEEAQVRVVRAETSASRSAPPLRKATLGSTVFAYRKHCCGGPEFFVGRPRRLAILALEGKLYLRMAEEVAQVIGQKNALRPSMGSVSVVDAAMRADPDSRSGGDKLAKLPRIDDFEDIDINDASEPDGQVDELGKSIFKREKER